MNKKEELQKVFDLYSKSKYTEAKNANDAILASDPTNLYAKKYSQLIKSKLKGKSNKSTKIGGKTLKCPHCISKIPFSGLTKKQIDSIKSKKYSNLEIKCPYCHTKFVLQSKKTKSIFGINIGDRAIYNGKNYRTVGYAVYDGRWYEGFYNGKTWYQEWILLGEQKEYLYFSEGVSYDDGSREEEFEFSHKIIPDFSFSPDYSGGLVSINGRKYRFTGYQKVKVTSVYGENSKIYNIGEMVELYEFKYKGVNYIMEKEGTGSQSEAGIYKSKSVNRSQVKKSFPNSVPLKSTSFKINKNKGDFISKFITLGFFGFVFYPLIENIFLQNQIILYIILGIILITLFFKTTNITLKYIYSILLVPILAFGLYTPIFNSFFEDKKVIDIPINDLGSKYEVLFNNNEIKQNKITGTTKYDYGGTRTYYEQNEGLKFSLKSEDDKKIIKKIIDTLDESNSMINNKEINNHFDGIYYKLK